MLPTLSPSPAPRAPGSWSRWHLLLPPGLVGALSLVCISSLHPHFLPELPSFTAQLFGSLAGSPQADMLVASFFAPQRCAYISIKHVSQPAVDDWVHLSFSSTTFTCLEKESVADSLPCPAAPDILPLRVSSPPTFEDKR